LSLKPDFVSVLVKFFFDPAENIELQHDPECSDDENSALPVAHLLKYTVPTAHRSYGLFSCSFRRTDNPGCNLLNFNSLCLSHVPLPF